MTARIQSTIVRGVAQRGAPLPSPTLASTADGQQTVVEKQAVTAPFYERWLGMAPATSDQTANSMPVSEPPTLEPADAPLPPMKKKHRQTADDATKPQASLQTRNHRMTGAKPVLPVGFMALAPAEQ
jgi:hypothetical protein